MFKQEYDDKTGLLVIQCEDGSLVETWTKGKPVELRNGLIRGQKATAKYFELDDEAAPSVSKWVTTGLLKTHGGSLRPQIFEVSELERFKREHSSLILEAKNRIRRDRSSVSDTKDFPE